MSRYLVGRIVSLLPVMLVVATFTFFLIHLVPGDPASMILGDMASTKDIERLRVAMNLNAPLGHQYISWLAKIARGDWGNSVYSQRPVLRLLADRAAPTLILSLTSMLVAVGIGVPTGILAAVKRGTRTDAAILAVAMFGAATPGFWLGLIMIVYISVGLGWLPTSGYEPLSSGVFNCLKYFVLPALALGIPHSALIIRITRSTMLDVLNTDYVRTARSKGLSNTIVIGKHALKNSLIPILTTIGMSFAAMIAGTVVTETVFSIPGMGRLVVQSVMRRDYPVLQGAILVVAAIYVIINLAVDLLYVMVDPRVKY